MLDYEIGGTVGASRPLLDELKAPKEPIEP